MPCLCAIFVTSRISTRLNVGFVGDSIHINFVSGLSIASVPISSVGVKVTFTPCAAATLVK